MKIHFPSSVTEFASDFPLVVRSGIDHSMVKYTPPRGLPLDVQFYLFFENTYRAYNSNELQKQGPSWSMDRFDEISIIHVVSLMHGSHAYNNLTNGSVSHILLGLAGIFFPLIFSAVRFVRCFDCFGLATDLPTYRPI
jgi:hypothetical protein